jgi:predicted DNA-binding transcriptional regulator AlpA
MAEDKTVRAEFLSIDEAAAWIGLSRSTLYRQLDEMPPRVQLSKRRLAFRRADIEAWILARPEHTVMTSTNVRRA